MLNTRKKIVLLLLFLLPGVVYIGIGAKNIKKTDNTNVSHQKITFASFEQLSRLETQRENHYERLEDKYSSQEGEIIKISLEDKEESPKSTDTIKMASRGGSGDIRSGETSTKDQAPKKSAPQAAAPSTEKPQVSESSKPSTGSQICEYAKKFIGVKYVYGGASPKGFDCSGFVKYVFNNFGIHMERVAANQARQGQKVEKSQLQPGDLVFFDTNGGRNYINHVGIYIGNGKFIHSSSSSVYSVTISDISQGFYANVFMTARRIVK